MWPGRDRIVEQTDCLQSGHCEERIKVCQLHQHVSRHDQRLQVWQLRLEMIRYPAMQIIINLMIKFEALIGFTYTILLLFKSKHFSRLRRGKPSNFLMSFSEKSIVSN
jgi:hypothetical protein